MATRANTINAPRFATRTRTGLFIAALTALLIGIGALLGGMLLYSFVTVAVAINVSTHPPIAERVRRLLALAGEQTLRLAA